MAFQQEPPGVANKWLSKMLAPLREWLLSTQVFATDDSIEISETPRGRGLRVNESGGETRPLTVLSAGAESAGGPANRVRVVLGGFMWGGTFWYADEKMDPQEDGSTEHPYFYLSGLADKDSIWMKTTLGTDGVFWTPTKLELKHGATVPVPTATETCVLLTSVALKDGVLRVASPQMVFGNQNARRIGVSTNFSTDLWPMLPDAR